MKATIILDGGRDELRMIADKVQEIIDNTEDFDVDMTFMEERYD